METKCRCGCAHVHTASQEKERVPVTPQGKGKFRWAMLNRIWAPLSSCLFLIMGVIFQQQEWEWFARPAIQFGWFLLGFLPVGFPVMREAVEGIMQREWFNEFSLMTLASVGAFYIGEYPEALAVMLLYTLGEMLQDKAVGKATRDIRRLLDVRPEQVEVYQEGAFRTVSPREVKVGELIEVRSGERVPLDGTLQNPHAVFDTSALTGEIGRAHV